MKKILLLLFVIVLSLFSNAQKLEFTIPFPRLGSLLIKYKGAVVDGKANGVGEAVNADDKNEKIYQGNWKDNLFDGEGSFWVQRSGSFDYYRGTFKNGKKNGKGFIQYEDDSYKKVTYDGDWIDDKRNGKGKGQNKEGIYEGDWVNDLRSGTGKMSYNSITENSYEGNWENDKRNGFGKMIYEKGGYYEGNWKNGLQEGQGKYVYPSGSYYEGNFANNYYSGKGKMVIASSGDSFVGEFEKNLKNGFGIYTFKNGDIYTGSFVNDLYEGEGVFLYADGRIESGNWIEGRLKNPLGSKKYTNGTYTGEVKDGFPEGYGKMEFTDGRVYTGQWSDKNINGEGIMIYKGYTFSGKWKDGHFIYGKRINDQGDYYNGSFKNDEFEDEKGTYTLYDGTELVASFANGKQIRSEGKLKDGDCLMTGIFENYKLVEKKYISKGCIKTPLNINPD